MRGHAREYRWLAFPGLRWNHQRHQLQRLNFSISSHHKGNARRKNSVSPNKWVLRHLQYTEPSPDKPCNKFLLFNLLFCELVKLNNSVCCFIRIELYIGSVFPYQITQKSLSILIVRRFLKSFDKSCHFEWYLAVIHRRAPKNIFIKQPNHVRSII